MQVKTLALVAAAVAVTIVQAYDSNACTNCVFDSISKDTNSRPKLGGIFGPTYLNVVLFSSLAQDPAIKSCVYHWTGTVFTSNGPAAGCLSSAAPTCNSTQLLELQTGIANIVPILNCGATATTSGGVSSTTASTSTPSGPTSTATATATAAEKHSIGAIIGGVVGGLVIVEIIASYFIYQRRKSKTTVNNTGSQKLEVHQQDDEHLPHEIQVQNTQNPSSPPMSQALVFQQQFAFSTHPKPKVITYMSDPQ
ncbi:hypothetical protein BGX26_006718 [Mortierella sp. AD094]|nr:hypothetical protein BGX26_006718 [Mortierella sp. AD094]